MVINNGFLIQYGYAQNNVNVNFPTSFTEMAKVVVQPHGSGANPGCAVPVINNSNFTATNGNAWGMHWVAAGY